jgi:Tol biopolymer transport system component
MLPGKRPIAAVLLCVLLVLLPAAVAEARVIEWASAGYDGSSGNGQSWHPAISADGRFVAFYSEASNLVPGDANGVSDLFVYDRETDIVSREVQVAGTFNNVSISADGRYLAFESGASNLVSGDTNNEPDVFVRDRVTGAVVRVDVATDGTQANAESRAPSISADGRLVAFSSWATSLVTDVDNNYAHDTFVHDMETGVTIRISSAPDGTRGNAESWYPSISANGRYVAFQSRASNLVAGDDPTEVSDIFVHDLVTGTTARVSAASSGTKGNADSYSPSISADGRYVAFQSSASNLVPGDSNGACDIFVYDRDTASVSRVSLADDGSEGDSWSYAPSISADGRYVAFHSRASNLVPGDDAYGFYDVFVHDQETGTTIRASTARDGSKGNESSYAPSLSADGRYVAFYSFAHIFFPGDTGLADVFVADNFGMDLPLAAGWNLVAGGPESYFLDNPLFGYGGAGYQSLSSDSMAPGSGYWCKAPATQTAYFYWTEPPLVCHLSVGWNLIGNCAAETLAIPEGWTAFVFAGTNYQSTSTLEPGQGAWIKSASATDINLEQVP